MKRTQPNNMTVDRTELESLAYAQATYDELLACLGVDGKTLDAFCRKTYKLPGDKAISRLHDIGKANLKKLQHEQARRSPTTAMWLSQQYLDHTHDQKIATGAAIRAKTRPPYEPDQLAALVSEYIAQCERSNKVLTLNGLAYFLGYSVEQLKDWPKTVTHIDDNGVSHVSNPHTSIIDYAITRIAMQAEERAVQEGTRYLEKLQPSVWKTVEEVKVSNTIHWGEYDKDL